MNTDSAQQNNKKAPLVYFVVGEPSGDLLASRLMTALKHATDGQVQFAGIGGETMCSTGFHSLFDVRDLAIMGLLEVVPSIPLVLRRIKQTLADIEARQPDVIVTVDSWGFTGRVNKALYKKGSTIPRVHYVAPQVWAWKAGRAKKMAGVVNHLLTLLPNEPEWFTPHGLDCTHVGHPVVEGGADKGNAQAFCQQHNINPQKPVLAVLPGSRRNEVQRLINPFKETVILLSKRFEGLQIVIPTVRTVEDSVRSHVANWPVPVTIVTGEKARYDAFAACDAALAASGTVALELAMSRIPHIIAYRVAPLTAFLARRLLKIKYANLINIICNREIIPEFIQEKSVPQDMANILATYLSDNEKSQEQLHDLNHGLKVLGLGQESPSAKAAQVVLDMINGDMQGSTNG